MVLIGAGMEYQKLQRESLADLLAGVEPYEARLRALAYGEIEVVTHVLHASTGYAEWRHEFRDVDGGHVPKDVVNNELLVIDHLYARVCERAARKMQKWRHFCEAQEEIIIPQYGHHNRNGMVIRMFKIGVDYRDRLLGRAYRRFSHAFGKPETGVLLTAASRQWTSL